MQPAHGGPSVKQYRPPQDHFAGKPLMPRGPKGQRRRQGYADHNRRAPWRPSLCPRIEGSIIRDELKDRMTEFSDKTPGFHKCVDGNATYFGAHSKFLIRLKKLFDDLHANTGKTQLSFQYDHQLPMPVQLDLFEQLEPTNIYLGYVPTENDPLNPLVYMVCNNEAGEIEWSIPLNREPPPPSHVLEPPAVPPSGPEEPRRVRIKNSKLNKKATDE
jgi:hypothetical protein